MPIDKFGRMVDRRGVKAAIGQPGIGFKFDKKGNFDITNKRLTNVKYPEHLNDAATKKYVDECLLTTATRVESLFAEIQQIQEVLRQSEDRTIKEPDNNLV